MANCLLRVLSFAALAACSCVPVCAQQTDDQLLNGFQNPPDSAKPRVWWRVFKTLMPLYKHRKWSISVWRT